MPDTSGRLRLLADRLLADYADDAPGRSVFETVRDAYAAARLFGEDPAGDDTWRLVETIARSRLDEMAGRDESRPRLDPESRRRASKLAAR